MSLIGSTVFLGWHDIAPGGEANFYDWHDREHVPERMAIPGFLRVRRYRAVAGGPRVMNVMELSGPDVLTGPAYQRVATHPTEWTKRTVPTLTGLARGVFTRRAFTGRAAGGFMLSARGVAAAGDMTAGVAQLETIGARPQVLAAHYLEDESAAEAGVVLVEAVSMEAALDAADLLSPAAGGALSARGPMHVYQLEASHQPG